MAWWVTSPDVSPPAASGAAASPALRLRIELLQWVALEPGAIPATSQFDWLISITEISVLS